MSVAKRTVTAGLWVVSGKALARCLDLVTLLVLSRLLTPDDFGLVAMAMSVVVITEALLELPLVQALVRIPKLTRPMFDTAFTLGLLRGLALAVILGGLAWPLGAFYEAPRLPPLICALALAPILRGMASPRMVVFMREMDFRREFALDLGGKFAALLVAVTVAVVTRSHWAIAAATIATPLTANVLSYVFAPYRPRLSLAEWGWFRNMVGWNSVAQVFSALNWQIDRLLLGRLVPRANLGRYAMASDLAGIPNQALVIPLLRPLIAAFSLRADPASRTGAYLKVMNAIFMVAAPVLLGMALLSAPLVRLALGESWDAAAQILFWVALIAMAQTVIAPMNAMAMAMDRTRTIAMRGMAEFVIRLPATVAGAIWFGIPGAIAARGLTAALSVFIGFRLVGGLIGVPVHAQIRSLWRTCAALCAMALTLWLLAPGLAGQGTARLAFATAAAGCGAGLVYLACLFGLWAVAGRPEGAERMVADKLAGHLGRA
ncbi:oligosaccharide flippase family protein [Amaricoccus sp. W119]|uniref:oligosaccharide flippase family protein n=1 Tax=Amaricoccus sp. W119 TaxID=3391833 RepID=UPI0039A594CB